jgi:site-specific recombinase XerD
MADKAVGRGWHLLRHTFASRAVQAGVTIEKIGGWMGHSSAAATRIYAHLAESYDPDIEKAATPGK